MRDWLRYVWQFAFAVIHQWGVLATGGFLVGIVSVSEHLVGRSIAGWPLWTAIALSLVAAFFCAWRKERQNWERLGGSATLLSTPKEMASVLDGRTTAQGKIIEKLYKGKWLRLPASIGDIKITNNPVMWCAAVTVVVDNRPGEPKIFLRFTRKWRASLSALQKGDSMTVLGRITSVDRREIWLGGCELIAIGKQEADTEE